MGQGGSAALAAVLPARPIIRREAEKSLIILVNFRVFFFVFVEYASE